MVKRAFWFAAGFGAGVGSSWYARRSFRRAATRYAPPEIASRLGGNVRAAVVEGRAAMRAREAELRGSFAAAERG